MTILTEPIRQVLDIKNYIGNEWIESKGEVVDVVNPATLKIIARVPIFDRRRVQRSRRRGK
jgi:acyl-CoA reductase-like NAD-dependent aldehyde dehydrogenase